MLTVPQALGALLEKATPLTRTEEVLLECALSRVLATNIHSDLSVPGADNSAMDGYAFRYADVVDDNTGLLIAQRVAAGHPGAGIGPGEAARIFTGAILPEGADTVMRQEWCRIENGRLFFLKPPSFGESVRKAGEDISKGALVLKKGTFMKPAHLGVAASVGIRRLPVLARPKVALMTTGDELVSPGEPLAPGKLYNSNRYAIGALLESFGCEVTDCGIVGDSLKGTGEAFAKAAQDHDLIVTSGGVSVGEEDHVKPAIEANGRLYFWRVAVKPGKPLAFGGIRKHGDDVAMTPILGLPGNPVSSYITFLLFVRPFILRMQGVENVTPLSVMLRSASFHEPADDRNEFLRARVNKSGEVELFGNQGSGVMSSVAWGSGLVNNPPGTTIRPGDMVSFIPFSGFFN